MGGKWRYGNRVNTLKYKSPFSPYNHCFYCSSCRAWILKSGARRDARGRPICPFCGKPLRTTPRNR